MLAGRNGSLLLTLRSQLQTPSSFRPCCASSLARSGGRLPVPRPILPPSASLASRTFVTRTQSVGQPSPAGMPGRLPEGRVIGVEAALRAASDPRFKPRRHIYDEFCLGDRVAVVTGANGDLGLEMAQALCEAGAIVYAVDLPATPSKNFEASAKYAQALGTRLEYRKADVTDQKAMWALFRDIADKEGRLDVTIAAAGILGGHDCREYPADEFEKILRVNQAGVFYTAQAAAREHTRLKLPGSVILIASMSGSITNRDHKWVGYNSSKSGVLQLARSMACELGPDGIRVNSLSPGHIYTKQTAQLLDVQPDLAKKWANSNPLGRLGLVHELRGAVVWLASDASTFCTGSDVLVSGGHQAW